ncbi:hypothetical protein EDC01DRAFT_88042 [Geopyxis carbonaria]|nr:hypothetical protein EDC01DRAFT_88042 [Geopyxis carbonaria]
MKIAIAGTGGLAQNIAQAALDEGYEVILLSRNEQPDLLPLEVVQVDYSVHVKLHRALLNVHTLISTISHSEPQLALIDACLTAGVLRFVPAEFEGDLDSRPLAAVKDPDSPFSHRDRFDVLDRLREERHRIESTIFVCGLFYERFAPGGLKGSGICASEGFMKNEADYLLNYRNATIPALPMSSKTKKDNGDQHEVIACFTAAKDVGKFVAKALGMEKWPAQLRCYGERMRLLDVIEIAEKVKGKKFSATEVTWDHLHDQLFEAEDGKKWDQVMQIDSLMATHRGEFDFTDPDLNKAFPEVKPVTLEDWLTDAWKGVDFECTSE